MSLSHQKRIPGGYFWALTKHLPAYVFLNFWWFLNSLWKCTYDTHFKNRNKNLPFMSSIMFLWYDIPQCNVLWTTGGLCFTADLSCLDGIFPFSKFLGGVVCELAWGGGGRAWVMNFRDQYWRYLLCMLIGSVVQQGCGHLKTRKWFFNTILWKFLCIQGNNRKNKIIAFNYCKFERLMCDLLSNTSHWHTLLFTTRIFV